MTKVHNHVNSDCYIESIASVLLTIENFVGFHLRKDACSPTTLSPILEAFQRKQLGQQEDAQEFFHFLVQELHNEMLQLLESCNIADKKRRSHFTSAVSDEDEGWSEVGKNGKSALVRNEVF